MKYLIKKPDTFLNAINEDINCLLHRSFDNIFPEYLFNQEVTGMAMPVDIKEYDDSYKVKVELPGIKKDNVTIDINKSSIKIEAHKESEKEKEDKKHKYHKSEFRYGHYARTLYFPQDVSVKDSVADLKNGVLHVTLPKIEKEEHKTQKLEIKEK